MCINPKKILNRSAHWNENLPLYLVVPCGKCQECRSSIQRDWFVRAYYEWQKNRESTYFYTLTYNNDHLPRFADLPCFSKHDVQTFIKRLRYYLDEYGVKLKYFISSEFGELYQRPHYHALFFLSKSMSPYLFYKLIQRAWIYGFIKYGDNVGVVNSQNGLNYVTKYVTKDFSHVDKYLPRLARCVYLRYNALFDYLRKRFVIPSNYVFYMSDTFRFKVLDFNGKDVGTDKECSHYSLLSKFLSKCNMMVQSRIPFHVQSTNLGLDASNTFSHDELLRELVFIPNNKGGVSTYRLPRFYKRSFWYDRIENELDGKCNKFVLNELGKKHRLEKLELDIKNCQLEYKSLLLNKHLIDNDVLLMVNSMSKLTFTNKYELVNWLDRFDLHLDVLSVYSKVFRNMVCPFKYSDIELTDSLVLDNWYDYVRACLYEESQYDYGKIYEKFMLRDKSDIWGLFLWNNHPYFSIFEEACTIFDAIDIGVRSQQSKAKEEREKNVRKLRDLFNKLST